MNLKARPSTVLCALVFASSMPAVGGPGWQEADKDRIDKTTASPHWMKPFSALGISEGDISIRFLHQRTNARIDTTTASSVVLVGGKGTAVHAAPVPGSRWSAVIEGGLITSFIRSDLLGTDNILGWWLFDEWESGGSGFSLPSWMPASARLHIADVNHGGGEWVAAWAGEFTAKGQLTLTSLEDVTWDEEVPNRYEPGTTKVRRYALHATFEVRDAHRGRTDSTPQRALRFQLRKCKIVLESENIIAVHPYIENWGGYLAKSQRYYRR